MCHKILRPDEQFPRLDRQHFPSIHFGLPLRTGGPISFAVNAGILSLVLQIQSSPAPAAMTMRLNQIVRFQTFRMCPTADLTRSRHALIF